MTYDVENDMMYMDIARRISERSHDLTRKVGAVLVLADNILSYGWNGRPPGEPNDMEYGDLSMVDSQLYFRLRTRQDVMHAEMNAFRKLMRTTVSTVGATLYTTLEPCGGCAPYVHSAGVIEVVYEDSYKNDAGTTYLRKRGLTVRRIGE
jgi:dCMP deaminase